MKILDKLPKATNDLDLVGWFNENIKGKYIVNPEDVTFVDLTISPTETYRALAFKSPLNLKKINEGKNE